MVALFQLCPWHLSTQLAPCWVRSYHWVRHLFTAVSPKPGHSLPNGFMGGLLRVKEGFEPRPMSTVTCST